MKQIMVYGAREGEKNALDKIQGDADVRATAQTQVDDFIIEIKGVDKEFDDKAFFAYANKYNFPLNTVTDLRSIYRSYVDTNQAVADAKKEGAGNREGRDGDTVNKPGSGSGEGKGVPFSKISKARSSSELVHDALHPRK